MLVQPRKKQGIRSETDVVVILSKLRSDAIEMGFDDLEVSRLVTAASELVRNILKYAGTGHAFYTRLDDGSRTGLEFVASDRGPGIPDLEEAMTDNFSSSGTLGMGLPSVKRMVDEFSIQSEVGVGTTVSFKVWKGK